MCPGSDPSVYCISPDNLCANFEIFSQDLPITANCSLSNGAANINCTNVKLNSNEIHFRTVFSPFSPLCECLFDGDEYLKKTKEIEMISTYYTAKKIAATWLTLIKIIGSNTEALSSWESMLQHTRNICSIMSLFVT